MLIRRNPFAVIEGALIAAYAMDATRVVLALRGSFKTEIALLKRALSEVRDVGWSDDVTVEVFAGPEEYLVGEETGLLEAIAGRPPFPRVSPPYRFGIDEIEANAGESAQAQMTTTGETTDAAPTLVNNAETMAHVAMIAAEGPTWFREYGTDESPGTIVCTVSGDTIAAGVGEFAIGTPLSQIIEELGGGVADGSQDRRGAAGCREPARARLGTRHSRELRGARSHRQRPRVRGVHRVRRHARLHGRRPGLLTLPRGGVVRPVHPVQAGRARAQQHSRPRPQRDCRRHRPARARRDTRHHHQLRPLLPRRAASTRRRAASAPTSRSSSTRTSTARSPRWSRC